MRTAKKGKASQSCNANQLRRASPRKRSHSHDVAIEFYCGVLVSYAMVTCNHGVYMLQNSRSSRDKVRLHRQRLRAQGLRPVQIWVPDVRARSFIAAARKQSKAVAASEQATADQQFIDAVSLDSTE